MGDGTIGSTAAELQGLAKEAEGKEANEVGRQVEGAVKENRAEAEQATHNPDAEAQADGAAD